MMILLLRLLFNNCKLDFSAACSLHSGQCPVSLRYPNFNFIASSKPQRLLLPRILNAATHWCGHCHKPVIIFYWNYNPHCGDHVQEMVKVCHQPMLNLSILNYILYCALRILWPVKVLHVLLLLAQIAQNILRPYNILKYLLMLNI